MYNPFFPYVFFNVFVILIVVWTVVWKIYAVWIACKHNHKRWFVALIILNTMGILEIFYIFKIVKKRWVEVREDFNTAVSSKK